MNHANPEEIDEIKMALEAAQTMADRFLVPIAILYDLQIRACTPENHNQTIEVVRPDTVQSVTRFASPREGRYSEAWTHIDLTNQKSMEGINNPIVSFKTTTLSTPGFKPRGL